MSDHRSQPDRNGTSAARRVRTPAALLPVAACGLLLIAGGISGCGNKNGDRFRTVSQSGEAGAAPSALPTGARSRNVATPPAPPPRPDASGGNRRPRSGFVKLGTGVFVDLAGRETQKLSADGTVTLNFEDTALSEVVKVILGDLLGQNYIIDPSVQGRVSLQSNRPVARKNLVPTLEMLLRINGAAVVLKGGMYHVVPRQQAAQASLTPQLGDTEAPLPQGYALRVVPLRFVSAAEMAQILEPFAPPGSVVRADTTRNLLLFAGSVDELTSLSETVRIFDVDWLKGMSFGLFRPQFVDAATLARELGHVFGATAQKPDAALIKIVPIERLDSLLVVSPRPEYLTRVAEWIERFDRGGAVGSRFFVYAVENGKAVDLAGVLNRLFERPRAGKKTPPAQLAPGLKPADIRSADAGEDRDRQPAEPGKDRPVAGSGDGILFGAGPEVRIIADEVNNALLIMATAQQYRQVVRTLKTLDVAPLQVLIEATIAEVTLTGDLSLGLEWFLKNRIGSHGGEAKLDFGAAGLAPAAGFSYVLRSGADIRLVLNALASDSKLNIVSSPSLMVLSNRKASIQVGDQVPVTTQQQQATSADSNVVNNVEFRDTGVLLNVTPRVNPGGLVVLELEQEVSDVAPGSAGSLTPTIQQRKIASTVAVQSGETVVLGGLIRENENESQSGVPWVSKIPLIGLLFRSEVKSTRRTELVVLITPRAVQDAAAARRITDEFRSKMKNLKAFFDRPASNLSAPGKPEEKGNASPTPTAVGRKP